MSETLAIKTFPGKIRIACQTHPMPPKARKPAPKGRRPKPIVGPIPLAVVDAFGTAAANEYARSALARRGSAKAVAKLVAGGTSSSEAIAQVANRAKGFTGEIDLSASFSARAGLLDAPATARPNSIPTHPTDDILLHLAGKRASAVQVKTGGPSYVSHALASGRYESTILIANSEAVAALETLGVTAGGEVPTRLSFAGVDSAPLSATECRARTAAALTTVLNGTRYHDQIAPLLISLEAGVSDGIQTLGLNLLIDLVEAIATGSAFHFETVFARSAKAGAKVALRDGAVTWSHVTTFLKRGKGAFSARLIHRIASSTFVASAVADVVVETAFDLVDVYRGRLDWDSFLRNLGVNTVTAAGSAVGAVVAARLARNAPWPVALLLILGGMWLGSKVGRDVGEWLFDGEADSGWQPEPA